MNPIADAAFSALLTTDAGAYLGARLTCPECRLSPDEDAHDMAALVHFEYVLVRSHDRGQLITGECDATPTAGLGFGRGTAVTFGLWCEIGGHRWTMTAMFHKGTIYLSGAPEDPHAESLVLVPEYATLLNTGQRPEMWRD